MSATSRQRLAKGIRWAARIMQSAQDLGYSWNKLPKLIYQDLCRPECDKCNLGCPHGAKWDAQHYIREAIENGAVMVDRAKVVRILTEGQKAAGVEYIRRTKKHRVYAEKLVIAAGGIGTPAILHTAGIKNAGNDFFVDPIITVFGTVKNMKGGKEIPMAAGMCFENEGYLMTDMTMPKFFYQIFSTQVGRIDKLLSHSKTLTIMVKAKDSLGGRVTDKGGVRKTLSKDDLAKLMKGYDRAKAILANAGAKNIYRSWYLASHPGGTAKIGETVDSNLETELKDLYVCDCSVIPESWGLPPILTIIGLGKRLANHIIM